MRTGGTGSEIESFVDEFRSIWWTMDSSFKIEGTKISLFQKIKNQNIMNKFLKGFTRNFQKIPKDKEKRKIWSDEIKVYIHKFIYNLSYVDEDFKTLLLENENFFHSTKDFFQKIEEFGVQLSIEDIGQGLRNVWIINIIQVILGEKVTMTNSIFGYSMLYPYTDNFLDDKEITKEHKEIFNERLRQVLNGEKITPINEYEKKIYDLVACIEGDYERKNFQEIYYSLIYIHNAQIKSLIQQHQCGPYEKDILGISIEKGGTSVLPDGYLVKGILTEEEKWFCFGYGFMLQIGDDLQDVLEDNKNNHMTIVSQLMNKYYLDNIAYKLMNFINFILDNSKCFSGEDGEKIKKIIKDNSIMMIYFAIAKHKKYYSKKLIKEIETFMPFSITYMGNINNKMKNICSKINKTLELKELELKEIILDIL